VKSSRRFWGNSGHSWFGGVPAGLPFPDIHGTKMFDRKQSLDAVQISSRKSWSQGPPLPGIDVGYSACGKPLRESISLVFRAAGAHPNP